MSIVKTTEHSYSRFLSIYSVILLALHTYEYKTAHESVFGQHFSSKMLFIYSILANKFHLIIVSFLFDNSCDNWAVFMPWHNILLTFVYLQMYSVFNCIYTWWLMTKFKLSAILTNCLFKFNIVCLLVWSNIMISNDHTLMFTIHLTLYEMLPTIWYRWMDWIFSKK